MEIMNCPQCRQQVTDNMKFCPVCGFLLRNPNGMDQNVPTASSNNVSPFAPPQGYQQGGYYPSVSQDSMPTIPYYAPPGTPVTNGMNPPSVQAQRAVNPGMPNPSMNPSMAPSGNPSMNPSMTPSGNPSMNPSMTPSGNPSVNPSTPSGNLAIQQQGTITPMAGESSVNPYAGGNMTAQKTPDGMIMGGVAVRKKSKLPLILILSGAVLLLAAAAVIFFLFFMPKNNGLTVNTLHIGAWEKLGAKDYQMTITSDQKEPFVAVLEEKDSDGDISIETVYLEDGKGTIQSSTGKYTYTSLGYLDGEVVTDAILTSINTNYDFDSFNLESMGVYSCTVDFDFTINSEKSGWLIFDSANSKEKDLKKDYIAVVCNGKGRGSVMVFFDDKPDRSNFNASFIPKYFIPADALTEGSYKVSTQLSFEKKEYSALKEVGYSGNEKILFSDQKDGVVLYNYELVSGGTKDYIGHPKYNWVRIENGISNLTTYHSFKNSDFTGEPEYKMEITGSLMWKPYVGTDGKGTNAVTVDEQDPSIFGVDFSEIVSAIGGQTPYCKIGSDGSYLKIDTNPYDIDDSFSSDALKNIKDANSELGFSDSLYEKMLVTSSLDGTKTDENDDVKVSWSYHKNNGLEVIYEKK